MASTRLHDSGNNIIEVQAEQYYGDRLAAMLQPDPQVWMSHSGIYVSYAVVQVDVIVLRLGFNGINVRDYYRNGELVTHTAHEGQTPEVDEWISDVTSVPPLPRITTVEELVELRDRTRLAVREAHTLNIEN